jgi:hypothetical protein
MKELPLLIGVIALLIAGILFVNLVTSIDADRRIKACHVIYPEATEAWCQSYVALNRR